MSGGLIGSEHMHGVLYEPHGSHIFYTEDREVWEFVNALTLFRPYGHRRPVAPAWPRSQRCALRDQIGPERVRFAGRLADYVYIDVVDCIRQALDLAAEVLESRVG